MQPSNKNRSDTAKLHQDLVDLLLKRQNIVSPEVEMAFRTVPRHLFLPGVTPEEAYRDQAIPVKVVDGQFLSTSSQPAMMAIMLEQLQLRPGMRVLEIGAGTGYNASLMAHIVGKSGQVITIDIDEDIVEGARTHLAEAGYGHVQVLCADGAQGCAQAAPYDRIILTVSAGDIAPDWLHQLAPGGRLLLPLALRSMQVSVAFEQKQDHLASVSVKACGFVGLRGMLAEPDTMVKLYEEPGQGMLFIRSGTARQVNPQKLYQAIYGPFREQLVGFEATAQQVFCGLSLWLSLQDPLFGELAGSLKKQSLVPELFQMTGNVRVRTTLGLIGEDTLCLLARAPGDHFDYSLDAPIPFPLVIRTFGPDGPLSIPSPDAADMSTAPQSDHGQDGILTSRLHKLLQSWLTQGRPDDERLHIRAYPGSVTPQPGHIIIAKKWMHFVCNWM